MPTVTEMMLQPIVKMRTGEHAGYEVLARFEEGPPDEVIDAARHSGDLVELDRMLINRALELLDGVPSEFYLSINCTIEYMEDAGGVRIGHQLSQAQRERVVGEITERSTAEHFGIVNKVCSQMRRLGFRYAVDDIGTAYGNVFRVMQLLPDIIKIDKSLVTSLDISTVSRAIIEGIVVMANRLRITTVAEGVETRDEMLWLLSLGVECGQGYLFGRPAPIEHWFPQAAA